MTASNNHYKVEDFARSSSAKAMNDFIEIMYASSIDSSIQDEMKIISDRKKAIEASLDEFREDLFNLSDDIKRRHNRLLGSCATCKPWLEMLDEQREIN